jgi:hypothetical protein
MQLEIFTLCDAATEHAGKLNIIGTFDALRALEAPIAHPQCAIAGRLRFEQIEEGNHRVSLTFADEDGNVVMPKFDSTWRPFRRASHRYLSFRHGYSANSSAEVRRIRLISQWTPPTRFLSAIRFESRTAGDKLSVVRG